MNSINAVIYRFDNITDYFNSREYKSNPKANIFTPLRSINSRPEVNNYLLNYDVNREIAKHLNLKDFAAFSSINVDNYLTLRSDNLLVAKVLDNESQARKLEKLEDLRQRANETDGGCRVSSEYEPHFFNYPAPSQAYRIGPAQLTCNTNAGTFRICRENMFGEFFQNLCKLANDKSVNELFIAHICSLAIDINNTIDQSNDIMAVYYADKFLDIAIDVKNTECLKDKENKLETLAFLIEEGQLSLTKMERCHIGGNNPDLSDWDKFLEGLREKSSINND